MHQSGVLDMENAPEWCLEHPMNAILVEVNILVLAKCTRVVFWIWKMHQSGVLEIQSPMAAISVDDDALVLAKCTRMVFWTFKVHQNGVQSIQ